MGLSQSVKWGRGCRLYSEELAQPGVEDQPRDHSQRLSAHSSAGPFLACGKALIPSSHFCKRQFKPGEPPFTPLHAPPLPLEPSSVTLPLCAQPWAQHAQAPFSIWTLQKSHEGTLLPRFTGEDTGQREKRLDTKGTQMGWGTVVQSLLFPNPKPGFFRLVSAKILDTDP